MVPSNSPDPDKIPPDLPSAAANNTWWRNRRFGQRRRKPFDPPIKKLYVPYEDRHDYANGSYVEVDGLPWEVFAVEFQPENDRAVVSVWPAGAIEEYNRGEG